MSTFLLLPLADVLEQKLLDPVNRTSEALLDEVPEKICPVNRPIWSEVLVFAQQILEVQYY